tara:strand:+ start:82 stop:429 length:348 start_codon:yes stop_codon:yes gene_type:complete
MTISNTAVVDTTLKYIVKSTGIKDEDNQIMVDAEKLKDGTNKSKVNLIECFYLIEGTGTITISASSEDDDLELTGKGKYGLRPDQLKFGNDKKILLSTNGTVDSYLMVTEFRRND